MRKISLDELRARLERPAGGIRRCAGERRIVPCALLIAWDRALNSDTQLPLLHLAARSGLVDIVPYLVETGADNEQVRLDHEYGLTVLRY